LDKKTRDPPAILSTPQAVSLFLISESPAVVKERSFFCRQRRGGQGGGSEHAFDKTKTNNSRFASSTDTAAFSTTSMTAAGAQDEQVAVNSSRNDGLAGVDISNAGVVVIDDRPDLGDSRGEGSSTDDFEEVLSKKARRARQQQMNELAELVILLLSYTSVFLQEKTKKLKEKEKMERAQARKLKSQTRRTDKKGKSRE
jgi:hypothetical protein